MYDLYSSHTFEEKYTYTGNDLGAVWSEIKTVFRVWAPTAEEVTVNLYRSGTTGADDLIAQLHMYPDRNGTWIAERFGDLNGIYYTYLVMVDGHICEACDPYARTTGVNGKRAMILNLDATKPLRLAYLARGTLRGYNICNLSIKSIGLSLWAKNLKGVLGVKETKN